MAFQSGNKRFSTNTAKGFPHGPGNPKGSVLPNPIKEEDGYSLWLEHVSDTHGSEMYWLMWYDKNGNPTINVSGVFDKKDLRTIANMLIDMVP